MGLPREGQCLKCGAPILIETMRLRPLCEDCLKFFENKISQGLAARGKNVKGKSLIFPKNPDADET